MVVSIRSPMVSRQFCVRPTFKRWFLRIIQVIMKHDLFDAMYESLWALSLVCEVALSLLDKGTNSSF